MFVRAFRRLSRNRLDPDAEHRAAALGWEFEHAVILRELGSNAGLPLKAAAPQGAHDLFGTLRRTEEIGIVDRDRARAAVLHLVDDFVDRPITEFQAVHQRLGAECASLMAAA